MLGQAPHRRRLWQRGRNLLVAHASDCHLFNGAQFLCGMDHFARKILVKKLLCFWTKNAAVVHGFCVMSQRCVLMCNVEKLLFCKLFSNGKHFSSKWAQN